MGPEVCAAVYLTDAICIRLRSARSLPAYYMSSCIKFPEMGVCSARPNPGYPDTSVEMADA